MTGHLSFSRLLTMCGGLMLAFFCVVSAAPASAAAVAPVTEAVSLFCDSWPSTSACYTGTNVNLTIENGIDGWIGFSSPHVPADGTDCAAQTQIGFTSLFGPTLFNFQLMDGDPTGYLCVVDGGGTLMYWTDAMYGPVSQSTFLAAFGGGSPSVSATTDASTVGSFLALHWELFWICVCLAAFGLSWRLTLRLWSR